MNIKKTSNLLINFTIKRLAEIFGLIILISGLLLLTTLLSYSPDDPNFIFTENEKIKNLLGFHGSFISDLFFQSIGLIAYLVTSTLIITGINIIRSKEFYLRRTSIGSAIPHVYPLVFNKIKIPKIEINEQEKIVNTFEIIQKCIKDCETQILKSKNLQKSIIKKIFNDV